MLTDVLVSSWPLFDPAVAKQAVHQLTSKMSLFSAASAGGHSNRPGLWAEDGAHAALREAAADAGGEGPTMTKVKRKAQTLNAKLKTILYIWLPRDVLYGVRYGVLFCVLQGILHGVL